MATKIELLNQFSKELSLRNYAKNSIDTYDMIIARALENREMMLELAA